MRYAVAFPVAVVSAVWSLATSDVGAQTRGPVEDVDMARATEMERQAGIAMNTRDRWSQAASLFRQASRVRSGADPAALLDLRTAGMIYAQSGRWDAARATLLELAERAAAFGEVQAAADAFIDVAFVEVQLGDIASARRWSERAERLAMSSHLTDEEHQRVARRLGLTVAVASTGR